MKTFYIKAIVIMLSSTVNIVHAYALKDEILMKELVDRYTYRGHTAYISYQEDIDCYLVYKPIDVHHNIYGLCDNTGKEIIPLKYDGIYSYYLGDHSFCDIKIDDKEGIYSIEMRKEIVPPIFDKIISNCGDREGYPMFYVEKDRKMGVWNLQGELFPPKYDRIHHFYGSRYTECELNGRKGLIDSIGREMISPSHTEIKVVGDSIAITINDILYDENRNISQNGKWGAYDLKNHREITKPIYDFISKSITEDILLCNKGGIPKDYWTASGGLWGCIDREGNEIVPFMYEAITPFEFGVAQVKQNGVVGLIENPLKGTDLQVDNISIKSPIDINIPLGKNTKQETFAVIIANESYPTWDASYAARDGDVMAKYCEKTFGIPKENISVYKDATYGNLQAMLSHCYDIADVYGGEASFIIYFAGIGYGDISTKDFYLLPTDAAITNIRSTALSLNQMFSYFNKMNINDLFVITDCPFNGVDRQGKSIVKGRGISIKNDFAITDNSVTWFSNSHTSQNKSIDDDVQHGTLTYHLLEGIQKNPYITLGSLREQVTRNTKESTLKKNGAISIPYILISDNKINQKL